MVYQIGVTDADWMRIALDEARKGVGRTAPNPPVGAVIVKGGELIGKGWHRAAGKPHAEREAIADATEHHGAEALKGSTIYITLEPCSTTGKTPPCTDGLIEAGIARVVYACVDANGDHSGRADELLKQAGVEVESGVLAPEVEPILRPFFKVQRTGLPWVIWKTAMSLDGRLTRPPGEGQWLTGEEARADVQKIRSKVDAILTTGETVRQDKPALTIRVPELLEGREQPWRVIFSDRFETLPEDAPLLADESKDRTLIRPCDDLAGSLRCLVSEQSVFSCMTEAGGVFSAALLEAGLIDEVVVYLAPMLCGGPHSAMAGDGFPRSIRIKELDYAQLGQDVRMRGLIERI